MTKKQRALEIIERLKKEYPDAGCTLDYDQAWKLLVSVRLAAQCTDARVNVVVEGLYEKYPDVNALADADVKDIEAIVRPCGLGASKARDISACMKILRDEYGGKVPDDFDALLKLPGVGRKSANLIMGDVLRKTGYCYRYALYPSRQPDGACGRDQRAEESRDGSLENYSSRGGKRFLPQTCISRTGCLYGKNKAALRQMLPCGYMQKSRCGTKNCEIKIENKEN